MKPKGVVRRKVRAYLDSNLIVGDVIRIVFLDNDFIGVEKSDVWISISALSLVRKS